MLYHQAKSFLCATASAFALAFSLAASNVAQTLPDSSARKSSQSRVSVQLKATLGGYTRSISEIAFSPDGELLATGSEDDKVRLWSAATGEPGAIFSLAEKHRLNGFIWSHDGRKLAVVGYRRGHSGTGQIRIWEARTGELKATIELNHTDFLSRFVWSPDGRVLLTASEDGTAKLWDALTGQLKSTLEQEPLRPDETSSLMKALFTRKKFSDIRNTNGYFDTDGQSVLTLSEGQPPKLWDATNGRLKTELPLTEKNPDAAYFFYPGWALFSPDRRLVVRADSHGVTLLYTTTGEVNHTFGEIGRPLAFSPDGRALLTIEYEIPRTMSQLSLWEVATGQKIMRFESLPYGAKDIYWNPKGNTLVVEGYYDMHTRLMDARTGRVIAKLPYNGCIYGDWFGGSSSCGSFNFSADGRIMFKQTNPLKLWSAETGELLTTLETTNTFAEFSPTDKRLLVTRSKDKKAVLMWEITIN